MYGRRINEDHLADLVECCHENAPVIDSLALLPLAETWEPGRFKTEIQTTREDVEEMFEKSIPGGRVEFVPAGFVQSLRPLYTFFRPKAHRFGVSDVRGRTPRLRDNDPARF